MNHKFNGGALPPFTNGDVLFKHRLSIVRYVGRQDENLLVAMKTPELGETQSGVEPLEQLFGSQAKASFHPNLQTRTIGQTQLIGSQNSLSPLPVKRSQIMPSFLPPVGDHPFFSAPPATEKGKTGEKGMKASYQNKMVTVGKRNRSKTKTTDQFWNYLKHAEHLNKSPPIRGVTPRLPSVPLNKQKVVENRRPLPNSKDNVPSKKKGVRQGRDTDEPVKNQNQVSLRENPCSKREQMYPWQSEIHSLLLSRQTRPLSRPVVASSKKQAGKNRRPLPNSTENAVSSKKTCVRQRQDSDEPVKNEKLGTLRKSPPSKREQAYLRQSEIHSLRLSRQTSPLAGPAVPSNKQQVLENQRPLPNLTDNVIPSKKNGIRERQYIDEPVINERQIVLSESLPSMREQVYPWQSEIHSLLLSRQRPLSKPAVTMDMNVVPPNVYLLPPTPILNKDTPPRAGKKPLVSSPRDEGIIPTRQNVPNRKRDLEHSAENAAVRMGSNQLMHHYDITKPHPAMTYEGRDGHCQLNGGSYLQPPIQKGSLHRIYHKLLHDRVRQKLRYELQRKERKRQSQRFKNAMASKFAPILGTSQPSKSEESVRTQRSTQPSNLADSLLTNRKRKAVCKISRSTPRKDARIIQNGNKTHFKTTDTVSSSSDANTLTSKGVCLSTGFPTGKKNKICKEKLNSNDRQECEHSFTHFQMNEKYQTLTAESVSGERIKYVQPIADYPMIRENIASIEESNLNGRNDLVDTSTDFPMIKENLTSVNESNSNSLKEPMDRSADYPMIKQHQTSIDESNCEARKVSVDTSTAFPIIKVNQTFIKESNYDGLRVSVDTSTDFPMIYENQVFAEESSSDGLKEFVDSSSDFPMIDEDQGFIEESNTDCLKELVDTSTGFPMIKEKLASIKESNSNRLKEPMDTSTDYPMIKQHQTSIAESNSEARKLSVDTLKDFPMIDENQALREESNSDGLKELVDTSTGFPMFKENLASIKESNSNRLKEPMDTSTDYPMIKQHQTSIEESNSEARKVSVDTFEDFPMIDENQALTEESKSDGLKESVDRSTDFPMIDEDQACIEESNSDVLKVSVDTSTNFPIIKVNQSFIEEPKSDGLRESVDTSTEFPIIKENHAFIEESNSDGLKELVDTSTDFSMIDENQAFIEESNSEGQKVSVDTDFPMTKENQTFKKESNFGDRHVVKSYQLRKVDPLKEENKLMQERIGNIKIRNGVREAQDIRHKTNSVSAMKHVVGPTGWLDPMTCGEFLYDIVLPMMLVMSNKNQKNQEDFALFLNLWRTEQKHSRTDPIIGHECSQKEVTGERVNRAHDPNVSLNSETLETEDLGKLLLLEEAHKTKTVCTGGGLQKGKTDWMVKDAANHENQATLRTQTRSKWDEHITSTTDDTLANKTTAVSGENHYLREEDHAEECDDVSFPTPALPRMKSVRVVLRTSDRIRVKFYNVDGSHLNQSSKNEENRGKKRKRKRRKDMKKKKIMLRIGSEKLFTRFIYCSSILPRKPSPERRKNKAKAKIRKLPGCPKEFNRIALSVRKDEGETILHRAVRANAKEVFLFCLESNICDINAKDNAGYTPLHECCVFDKVWMAEKLILYGADVNASAHDGTRPIHDAVENHRAEMTRLLLSHGADPLLPTYAKRTAFNNATSLEIKSLLHDYLIDMNGGSEKLSPRIKVSEFNRQTIRVKSSFSTQLGGEWADNFLDTSNLNETTEDQRDSILYLKEIPHPKHVRFQLKENEKLFKVEYSSCKIDWNRRVKTWYLLSDVLARLKIPAATFPYLYPHIKINGLPTSIFLKKVERENGLNQFDISAIRGNRELVEFVEADNEMCSILQFEDWVS